MVATVGQVVAVVLTQALVHLDRVTAADTQVSVVVVVAAQEP
jgi:hypothetical protein